MLDRARQEAEEAKATADIRRLIEEAEGARIRAEAMLAEEAEQARIKAAAPASTKAEKAIERIGQPEHSTREAETERAEIADQARLRPCTRQLQRKRCVASAPVSQETKAAQFVG